MPLAGLQLVVLQLLVLQLIALQARLQLAGLQASSQLIAMQLAALQASSQLIAMQLAALQASLQLAGLQLSVLQARLQLVALQLVMLQALLQLIALQLIASRLPVLLKIAADRNRHPLVPGEGMKRWEQRQYCDCSQWSEQVLLSTDSAVGRRATICGMLQMPPPLSSIARVSVSMHGVGFAGSAAGRW